MLTTQCNGLEIRLSGDLGPFVPALNCEPGEAAGIFYVTLDVRAPEPALMPSLTLSWGLPSVSFHHKWNSRCLQNRALDVGVGSFNRVDSCANSGMPVFSLYSLDATNACTWALSDVVHDTKTGGDYGSGKVFKCNATIIGNAIGVVDSHRLAIRFDFRPIPYYDALRDVSRYWEQLPGCEPCAVPDAAREALLSSWYIYELDVDSADLETQCELGKEMGFGTVILDDGWQTNQREFGYQNNGDWEVSLEKFPDFAGHVKRVQAHGMKYMVWFSVPFIGVDSKAYSRFKDMLMPGREGARWFSVDLRFPETRDYLVNKYVDFVTRYGVDGLKMDFIGSVLDRDPAVDILADGRRDCVSMGEAMCRLLEEATSRLRRINPDILIEFRQDYTGPAMRAYGNMFRAVDCPNSIGDNRVRTLDVRLLCGNTAVHSDPITWHDEEPDHSAAMQIIHALFSVPQISMRISELCPSHRQMLKHQLAFMRKHADVLQHGELRPLFPHLLFPLVVARTEDKLLAAYYSEHPLHLDEELPTTMILVNGSYAGEVLLDLKRDLGAAKVTVTDCCGNQVGVTMADLGIGLHRLAVPPAGSIQIQQSS